MSANVKTTMFLPYTETFLFNTTDFLLLKLYPVICSFIFIYIPLILTSTTIFELIQNTSSTKGKDRKRLLFIGGQPGPHKVGLTVLDAIKELLSVVGHGDGGATSRTGPKALLRSYAAAVRDFFWQ